MQGDGSLELRSKNNKKKPRPPDQELRQTNSRVSVTRKPAHRDLIPQGADHPGNLWGLWRMILCLQTCHGDCGEVTWTRQRRDSMEHLGDSWGARLCLCQD